MYKSLLVKFVMLQTKLIVNSYTAFTLPFYYFYQQPWKKLNLSKSFQVRFTKDKNGRTIYSRPTTKHIDHPYYSKKNIGEFLQSLDRNRFAIGIRDTISEKLQYDKDGKPIIIDDRELTKIELNKNYKWYTVGEILDRADTIARGLKELGIDRSEKVMIYAENSLEWFLVALALNRLCAITVTLFSTLSNSGVLYGLNQSEARYLIIAESLLKKINKIKDKIEFIEKIVYIPNNPASYKNQDPGIKPAKEEVAKKFTMLPLEQIYENGLKIKPYEFPKMNQDDYLLIMYTSGTTGNPKGVILTNENFLTCLHNLLKMDQEEGSKMFNATYPAYLPMAHFFGYMVNIGMFLSNGRVAFASSTTLMNTSPAHVSGQIGDIKLIQPDLFPTVPLVLERLIKEIYVKLNARSQFASPIFTYLMEYKIRWMTRGYDTPIINKLICEKIMKEFGGRLQTICVGSAPLHERTHAFAKAALNIETIINAYGTTELTGASHTMKRNDLSFGRVGVPYDSVKYYLEDWIDGGYTTQDKPNPRGEIVVGGPTVALGYYKMPEETSNDFYTDEDGCRWFRTGDIGEVFPDGTLKIIDRRKDLTKLPNGEFISLGKLESGLRSSGYVENVCVCTDPYQNEIIALIVPNKRTLSILSKQLNKQNLSFEQLCDDPEIVKMVLQSIQKKCEELEFKKREIPVRIVLVKEEWTQKNNMLTAAFKLRRKAVQNYYKDIIQSIYKEIQEETETNNLKQTK